MMRYLLRGDYDLQKEFIESVIKENKIKNHFIITYDPPFSIKNAHALKSLLSLALPKGEKRMIVIPSDMSLESQNAVLKLIEELDDQTYLYIRDIAAGELLPTILSRVSVIRLNTKKILDPEIVGELAILNNPGNNRESLMKLSVLLAEYKNDAPVQVISYLREQLYKDPSNKNILKLLQNIYEDLEIYYKNNLHKRFFWDMVLLSSAK